MGELISKEVKLITNYYGDEIEFDIFRYYDHYSVIAIICDDEPPFRDFTGVGKHPRKRNIAIQNAINDLYSQAYNIKNNNVIHFLKI